MADEQKRADGLRETGPSRGGSNTCWSVQVRAPHFPCAINEHIFTKEWVDLPMYEVPPGWGVPMGPKFDVAPLMGFLTYAAAQAMRWCFLAHRAAEGTEYKFETRLVKHELRYDIKTKPVEARDEVNHLLVIRAEHDKPTTDPHPSGIGGRVPDGGREGNDTPHGVGAWVWTPTELAAAKERGDEYADWFLTNAPGVPTSDQQSDSQQVMRGGDGGRAAGTGGTSK